MNFWSRRRYRRAYETALTQMFAPYPSGINELFRQHPHIKKIFGRHSLADQNSPQALACIAARPITRHLLSMLNDGECREVKEELQQLDFQLLTSSADAWANGMTIQLQDDLKLITNIVGWAAVIMERYSALELVDESVIGRYFDYVRGVLDGLSDEEIDAEELGNILHEGLGLPTVTLGDDDRSRILPTLPSPSDPPNFIGRSVKIHIDIRGGELLLKRQSDGEVIWCSSSVKEDFLKNAPNGLHEGELAQIPEDGIIRSCIIAGPEHNVYGDSAAFWWSFAKATVVTADVSLRAPRYSENAFDLLKIRARSIWERALEESDYSVQYMRSCSPIMKNVHHEAISGLMTGDRNSIEFIGAKVALAMVVATFSLDRLLEERAFSLFGGLLWPTGDVPIEFLSYYEKYYNAE